MPTDHFAFQKCLASLGKGEIALLKMQPPNNNNNNNNTLQKFLTSFKGNGLFS
jgi:hypothetical protein